MNELALFAGAGGGVLGGHLLGWRTVCAVEFDPYARDVLLARQNDGCLRPFPVWDDVRTFDGAPWRGRVDVVSGGFPCQDISAAGKGAGIEGERSGLWADMARIIREVRPRFAFVENSPVLTSRGLGVVLGDLAAMGFDARWCVLGAHHAGAPHRRDRIWVVADRAEQRRGARRARRPNPSRPWESEQSLQDAADAVRQGLSSAPRAGFGVVPSADGGAARREPSRAPTARGSAWEFEPNVGRVANGVAARVDRLRCIGNGQVPSVAALAWLTLTELGGG